ncbi:MAG: DUF1653 domain-containing protein [Christensenellaceae bacterium]|jgi:hypothetical protein|nr:DUF1653 domain-containing protein [Christensenellaceae bacterium]
MSATINFQELFDRKITNIQIKGEGRVSQILNDDLIGRKHQRFVVELARHQTVMIINNIDIFERVEPLLIGDHVEFCGEYIWNRHGGIVHWTHDDPKGVHESGYIKLVSGGGEFADSDSDSLKKGAYRHYSGALHSVIGFALNESTREKMVIFDKIGDKQKWVLPLSVWNEMVEVDGKLVKRYELLTQI